jgi:hypothetical protein
MATMSGQDHLELAFPDQLASLVRHSRKGQELQLTKDAKMNLKVSSVK